MMIKALNAPQMVSAKPRTGLNNIGDLIPRLIRHYEALADFRHGKTGRTGETTPNTSRNLKPASQQQSFSWYES